MSSFEDFFGLELPVANDTSWKAANDEHATVLGQALCPERCYYVSPDFDTTNLSSLPNASDRRYFDTIQGAIDAGEAAAFDRDGYTIIVFPGLYAENLTITRSVRLVAADGRGRYLGGGRTMIQGVNSIQASTITIDPIESDWQLFSIEGFIIENLYDTAGGTQINDAYAVDLLAQTTTGALPNTLELIDCCVRMQTFGTNNNWAFGIRAAGWNNVLLRRCDVGGLDYGGGSGSAGIQKLVRMDGYSTSKKGTLNIQHSNFSQTYSAAGTPYTVSVDNDADAVVLMSSTTQGATAAGEVGGTGTNSITGFTSTGPTTHHNVCGFGDFTIF